jgi:tetratricopeptide (TPR) repeat protein
MRALAAGLLLAASIAGASAARARLTGIDASGRGSRDLLYMPSGKYLKVVSLGNSTLAADVVYLWAIQYYSDYDRKDRYRYVEHVFGDVIGDLDPEYVDPYYLGAIILTTEGQDLEAGLRLLDKGFARTPTAWILPFLAGWECDRARQFDRAAAYFDRAAAAPGAPPQLLRLKAGMTALGGNLREAIARWRDVLDDPRADDSAREIAQRQIRSLTVKADTQDLDAALAAYRDRFGRWPHTLDELVRAGLIASVPDDPDGKAYAYDPADGRVSSAASRVLGS